MTTICCFEATESSMRSDFVGYVDTLYLPKLDWFDEDLNEVDKTEAICYVSCKYLSYGDYSGYGAVGMANYLYVTETYSEDVKTVWGNYGYTQALLPLFTGEQIQRAKDIFSQLTNYPLLSEERLAQVLEDNHAEECREYRDEGYNWGFDIGATMDLVEAGDEGWLEAQLMEAYEIDDNERQDSSFAFIASNINKSVDSEPIWESFEEGVNEGLVSALNIRFATQLKEK
jgi:hypothetical protein